MKKKLVEVNEISDSVKKSFKLRVITSIVLALILLPSLFVGNWLFAVCLFIVSLIAYYEFINILSTKKFPIVIDIFTFFMSMVLTYWGYMKLFFQDALLYNNYIVINDISVSTLALATMMLILFLFALMYTRFDVTDVCYLVTMGLLISLGFQSFYFLRYSPMSSLSNYFDYGGNQIGSSLLMLYVAIGSFMNDIGAYGVGILFGKHKINPRISPKKTWEGFFGGIIISFVASSVFALVLDFNGIPLLKGTLDLQHWYLVIILSLAMPFVSVLGDLLFSAIKRFYAIKDFSNVLPGHGGVLDRIDSLLVTAIVVTLIILAFNFYRGIL